MLNETVSTFNNTNSVHVFFTLRDNIRSNDRYRGCGISDGIDRGNDSHRGCEINDGIDRRNDRYRGCEISDGIEGMIDSEDVESAIG